MRIIRYVGSSKSSDPDYLAELAGSDVAVIDTLPGGYNVTVTFKREAAPVWVPLRAEYRDLLDVAVTTYIADELIARKDSIDSWSRNFDLLVPVKEPDRWRSAEEKLRHVLAVLSGDRYRLTWCPRVSLPDRVRHRQPLPRSYNVVCLFSGGLDSLLGAYRLLAQGRKVLLVGHQAEGITASAQTDLARTLRGLFPNRCSLVQCRVARAPIRKPRYQLPDKVEESHRPRSLLFLALALVVARAADINELIIAENGLIALNVPIQRSRLGTLSTRTAHPRYLEGLLDFLEAAGLFDGRIWNPFLFESKTDMLRSLPANLRDAALRSVSCSHAGRVPRRGGRAGVNHCGYCLPCLYRRAALIGAGIDDPSHYAHDVFQNLSSLTPTPQVDLRALVRFAERILAASEFEREAMVLAHGFFAANLAGRIGPIAVTDYSLWTAMLRRWADDFLDVVRRLGTPSTLGVLGLRTPPRRALR